MKALFSTIVLFLGLVLYSSPSNAGLLIEPLVGINYIDYLDIQEESNFEAGNGVSYGGRLGYQSNGLRVGIDYLDTSVDMADSEFNRNLELEEWGAFIGYKFPILFKAYAAYIFSAEGESRLNSLTLDLKEGKGYKLGIGTTFIPFIDINLDYRKISFDPYELGSREIGEEADLEAFLLSVSLPLDLF